METFGSFGCVRDCADPRDKKKTYGQRDIQALRSKVDLTQYVPQIYDQGKLESCTANAVCSAYGINLVKQRADGGNYYYFNPSRMFLWYNTRTIEKTEKINAPVQLRNTIKAFHQNGVCKEERWSYMMKYNEAPNSLAYYAARNNDIYAVGEYESLSGTDINQLLACLNEGFPIVFGFDVYYNFKNSYAWIGRNGVMPMADCKTGEGHAVVAVGYDNYTRLVTILNSWGSTWGCNGYFYMPYDFITSDYCHSFWKILFACEKPQLQNVQV